MRWLLTILTFTWEMLVEAAPWLLFGFVLAGIVHVWLPVERVTRHLGRKGLGGVLKAAALGAPLPLCSCSVIPVASSIRKLGAGRGAYVSFLISTPETGVDSISITYALLGPFMAVARPVAAIVTALVAGVVTDITGGAEPPPENRKREATAGNSCGGGANTCCDTDHGDSHDGSRGSESDSPAGPVRRLIGALRYGLGDMFADLSHWLLAGFVLAGAASALIPPGFFERYDGSGLLSMLAMLVVGLPLYVCATSSTPVAAALIGQGLSPGAALVFLLVGPATNTATMMIVVRHLGWRGLAVYLTSIAVVALGLGLLTDALVRAMPTIEPATTTGHGANGGIWSTVAAVVLLALMANGLRLRLARRGGSVSTEGS